ncbi:unnamed protein product [Closterium sp. NIES-65]|nr:unnamed protein product [Closterium sp. NIES-65]
MAPLFPRHALLAAAVLSSLLVALVTCSAAATPPAAPASASGATANVCPATKLPPTARKTRSLRCPVAATASCCAECADVSAAQMMTGANLSAVLTNIRPSFAGLVEPSVKVCDLFVGQLECPFLVEAIVCGANCNPDSGSYVNSTKDGASVMLICPEFADRIFSACKGIKLGTYVLSELIADAQAFIDTVIVNTIKVAGVPNLNVTNQPSPVQAHATLLLPFPPLALLLVVAAQPSRPPLHLPHLRVVLIHHSHTSLNFLRFRLCLPRRPCFLHCLFALLPLDLSPFRLFQSLPPLNLYPLPDPPRLSLSILSPTSAFLPLNILHVYPLPSSTFSPPHPLPLRTSHLPSNFVPNLTIGPPVIAALRKHTDAYLDCHLMVTDPFAYVESMKQAGASSFTFHVEAVPGRAQQLVAEVHAAGMRAGVAIKPSTPVESVLPLLEGQEAVDVVLVMTLEGQEAVDVVLLVMIVEPGFGGQLEGQEAVDVVLVMTLEGQEAVDVVLVMTVEPGFGGQAFMPDMMPKVQFLRSRFPELDIQVDGGLGPSTIGQAAEAGANCIVAGSSVFGASDPAAAIAVLRDAVLKAQQ